MIDLHSHILPGLDDGPKTLEESLALARAAVAAGTDTLVATPHIDWRWRVQPGQVHDAVTSLAQELASANIPLELRVGGEIALSRVTQLTEDELAAVALGGGPYLLLECPHVATDMGLELTVFELRRRGHKIVLAHPERCPAIQRDVDLLRKMVGNGALTSLTAGSLTGQFGRTVRNFAFELFRLGLAHNVASDAHDAHRRPPSIRSELHAARSRLPDGAEQIEWLVRDVPEAILAGTPPPLPPELAPARTGRSRMRPRRRKP